MTELSIIVPCYNEEDTILAFLEALSPIEQVLASQITCHYLFIDDGSSDHTLDLLRQVNQDFDRVDYLSFSRNFGKEAAILAGLEAAKGDLIVVMDADLQDPPELLPEMIAKINQGYDVVATRRRDRKGEPPIRSFFSNLFYRVINTISDTKIVNGARDYRIMTRQVVDSILQLGEVNRFSKGIFPWVGYKTTYLSYDNRERVAGDSSWNFWSLLKYSMDGFINFSETPLNIATWTGFGAFVLSLLALGIIILRRLIFGDPVLGWASTVSIILFMGGLQLFSIGIIGKYIAKIFLETKKRPIYLIKEKS